MKKSPIPEEEAEGELSDIFHDIQQTFRISGVNLNFRQWASYHKFFPVLWNAIRPVAETRLFEDSSDHIRGLAAPLADRLPRLKVTPSVFLGESQNFQIQAALQLYHYINPKLLVITSVVEYACHHPTLSAFQPHQRDHELIPRGVPQGMYPMEMINDPPEDPALRRTFRDIQRTLGLTDINSDYRTLALWPEYLIAAWHRLKPIVKHPQYMEAIMVLREAAQHLASDLLPRLALSDHQLDLLGRSRNDFFETTLHFTHLLPPLILNILLMSLDWRSSQELAVSPFPAEFQPPGIGPSS